MLHQGVCILLIRDSILHGITVGLTSCHNEHGFLPISSRSSGFLALQPVECFCLWPLWLVCVLSAVFVRSFLLVSLLASAFSCASMEQLEPLDVREDEVEAMSICFDDSLDLDERHENRITLVGLLIADQEPPQSVVKEVLRVAWSNMGVVKVSKAKPNVFAIIVGQEDVARRLMDGSPWFVKGYTLTVKSWPLYCSIDDIEANRAVFWVQAHGMPRNLCIAKNARSLGSRIGSVLEVEDNIETE